MILELECQGSAANDFFCAANGYILWMSFQGKTTLLNVLMKRISDLGKAHVQGSISLDDNPIPSWFPEVIGYVPQVGHLYKLSDGNSFVLSASTNLPVISDSLTRKCL